MEIPPVCDFAYNEARERTKEAWTRKSRLLEAAGKFNREVSDTLRGEVEEESRKG